MLRRAHRDLLAWQDSMVLVEKIYELTSTFPQEEKFGLSQQMRRAAVSVPSNIAEGAARAGVKERLQFLHIASGSLAELDTQLELALRLGFAADVEPLQALMDRVTALLIGLMKSLRRNVSKAESG
jgi:four helix bundle protein